MPLAHGTIPDSHHTATSPLRDSAESAGSAGRARCPPPPAQPRCPRAARSRRGRSCRGSALPGGRRAVPRGLRGSAPDTGAGTGAGRAEERMERVPALAAAAAPEGVPALVAVPAGAPGAGSGMDGGGGSASPLRSRSGQGGAAYRLSHPRWRRLPRTKRGPGVGRSAGRPGPPTASLSLLPPPASPRLAPPGRGAAGALRGSGPGRAGRWRRAPSALRRRSRACHRAGRREEPAPRRPSELCRSALRGPAGTAPPLPLLPGARAAGGPCVGGGRGCWGQHGPCTPAMGPLRIPHGPRASPAIIESVFICLCTGGYAHLTWALVNFGKC